VFFAVFLDPFMHSVFSKGDGESKRETNELLLFNLSVKYCGYDSLATY